MLPDAVDRAAPKAMIAGTLTTTASATNTDDLGMGPLRSQTYRRPRRRSTDFWTFPLASHEFAPYSCDSMPRSCTFKLELGFPQPLAGVDEAGCAPLAG